MPRVLGTNDNPIAPAVEAQNSRRLFSSGNFPHALTWKLNVSESKLGTPPQPARLAVTFEALGSDRMKVSHDQVYGDSHSWGHYDVRFDGQTRPAEGFPIFGPPQTPPITLIWTLHTYDLDNGTDGTLTLTTTVSADGRTMTGIGSDGTVQVFERQ